MSIIPGKEQEGVPDWQLRDDPEYQLRVMKLGVQKKVIEGLEKSIEPSKEDIEFLGD